MLHSGFAPLVLFGSLIEEERLDKAFRLSFTEGDERGLFNVFAYPLAPDLYALTNAVT